LVAIVAGAASSTPNGAVRTTRAAIGTNGARNQGASWARWRKTVDQRTSHAITIHTVLSRRAVAKCAAAPAPRLAGAEETITRTMLAIWAIAVRVAAAAPADTTAIGTRETNMTFSINPTVAANAISRASIAAIAMSAADVAVAIGSNNINGALTIHLTHSPASPTQLASVTTNAVT